MRIAFSPKQQQGNKQINNKLGRCDSYLQKLTHPLTDWPTETKKQEQKTIKARKKAKKTLQQLSSKRTAQALSFFSFASASDQ